jgi:hypothetical protein
MRNLTVQEFLRITNFCVVRPRIICKKDGFNISVQAGSFHYSEPTIDYAVYTRVELGFPTVELGQFGLTPDDNIYPYVDIEIANNIIESYGGIDIQKTFDSNFLKICKIKLNKEDYKKISSIFTRVLNIIKKRNEIRSSIR